MKAYRTENLRNVVLVGHNGSGKTTLVEAMLFLSGATTRMGRVEEGNTVSDFDEEEIRRRLSIYASLIPIEWSDHKINLLDAPGYLDFVGEMKSAVHVADCALLVVDSVAGVEVGTEQAWAALEERGVPRIAVISKMDRDNANFDRALESLRRVFKATFVPIQLPIGSQAAFEGVVDLIAMKARRGPRGEVGEVPAPMREEAEEARMRLVEAAAEADDELIVKYLEGGELTEGEIRRGLKAGLLAGRVIPVACAAGLSTVGVGPLLDLLVQLAPSPLEAKPIEGLPLSNGQPEAVPPDPAGPAVAYVFKITADPFVGKLAYFRVFRGTVRSNSHLLNVGKGQEERLAQIFVMRGKEQIPVPELVAGDIGAVPKLNVTGHGDTLCDRSHPVRIAPPVYPTPLYAVAVEPKTKADSAKLIPTLQRLCEEDPTLHLRQEPSTHQTILEGMGDTHIDVAVRRASAKFGVEIVTSVPKVPYRETITKVAKAQYRHKKQTGGAGQFGEVHLRIEPLPRDGGFEYVWEVFGGAISSNFAPSIEKGIRGVMEQGLLAGYPIVDVRVAVYDGKEHPVDSNDISFQIAGREAFKLAFQQAGPVLLEPIMQFTIIVPEQFTGDVISDLNTRRARVQGIEQQGDKSVIIALAPLAEMQRYATQLRSLTQGRGVFRMTFSHYEEVPPHIAQTIIEQARREREAAREKA